MKLYKWMSPMIIVCLITSMIWTTPSKADAGANLMGEMIKRIRTDFQKQDVQAFDLLYALQDLRDKLPDQPLDIEEEPSSEGTVAESLYTPIEQTVVDRLYGNPQPAAVPTQTFYTYLDQYLAEYESQLHQNYLIENRFVGTNASRLQLDLYRLLHSYHTAYANELSKEQRTQLYIDMSLLLIAEMKQAKEIQGDMNAYMEYRASSGMPLKPPSQAQRDVANRLWDQALEGMEKGIIVSPFVLLNNSIRASNRVLELFEMQYAKEMFSRDSDLDGVSDLIELQYQTNVYRADTDGDGLRDPFELSYQNTLNPNRSDSDQNGVTDDQEDKDHDGLLNKIEQELNTSPILEDTDRDKLKDGDESHQYFTNPTLYDTDKDRVADGKEIEIGTNPTLADSNGDGQTDFNVTVMESVPIIEEDLTVFKNTGVVPSVIVEGRPNAGALTTLSDAYQYDSLIQNMEGIVGHPIDLTTSSSFDKATIQFQVSESLSDVHLEQLRVMWWDEQNQQMVLLPNQKVDRSTRTVSAETTHFSKYALIDIDKWVRIWQQGYDPGKPSILRGRIQHFTVANTYPYQSGSLMNYGVVDRGLLEAAIQIGGVNKNLVQTQQFSFDQDSSNFVSEAINRLANDSSIADQWKILIVASDNRRFDDSGLQSALQVAEDHQIKVFTTWTSDHEGSGSWDLQTLAKKANGNYYVDSLQKIDDSMELFKDMWKEVLKEEDVDRDGIPDQVEQRGILLGTGERILTSTIAEDRNGDGMPDGMDTDADGVTDGYELGYTDRDGRAHPYAQQKPVISMEQLRQQPAIPSIVLRSGPDCTCGSSAVVKSSPIEKDTDFDETADHWDVEPLNYYKRPIFMLHGVTSNAINVFGAPNAIASEGGLLEGNLLNNFFGNLRRDYLVNMNNQAVIGEGIQTDGLYYYLKEYVKDSRGRPLFVHGDNMFVFNYANLATYDFNAELFRDYINLLRSNGKLKGPIIEGDDPKIDILVHSMGGLVARWYNERLWHTNDISALITISTPHRGGNYASIASFTAPITDRIAAAFSSLSALDFDLATMNRDLIKAPNNKHGAKYYAMGGVVLPELPSAMKQQPFLDSYEYRTGVQDNYEENIQRVIENEMQHSNNTFEIPDEMKDGAVMLNSAFGAHTKNWPYWPYYQEPVSLPFEERYGYVGTEGYIGTDHSGMHHNPQVKIRIKDFLKRL